MRVRSLPKSWLIHTIEYIAPSKKDDWGNEIESNPITIEYVRYDNSSVFSRDSTQTKVLADGVIFVDAVNSSPIPNFKEEGKVIFEERELTIKKVIPCYYPNKNAVRHWELEVI